MIAMPRRESGDDGAVAADIVDIGDALPAAPGAAIVIGGGQLAIAIGADGEDELFLRGQFDEAFRAHLRRSFLRSEEHTSELQSLMRISYAVFCLKKKKTQQ